MNQPWLTALDVSTGQVWQADRAGRLQAAPRRSVGHRGRTSRSSKLATRLMVIRRSAPLRARAGC
jgi:hypothetical protein